jgi:hypothetical protein
LPGRGAGPWNAGGRLGEEAGVDIAQRGDFSARQLDERVEQFAAA